MTEAEIERLGEDVPLLEGIRTTRAIRRLKRDPVPPALIRKVCEAGTFAPSGGNRQPWIFLAVTELETKLWVAERYRKVFRPYIAPAVEAAKDPSYGKARRLLLEGSVHLSENLEHAPVLLFVAARNRRGGQQPQSIYPAVQNVLLACRAVGLGASLTSIHTMFGEECDRHLGLPETCSSYALLPIGWPEIPYKRPNRRPIDECLHWERFSK